MKKMVNGIEQDLTQTEIDEFNLREQQFAANAFNRLKDNAISKLELHINDTAKERSYNSGVSCSSYTSSNNLQWKAEADVFIAWRDSVWLYAYQVLSDIESNTIPAPSLDEFIASLPTIVWP